MQALHDGDFVAYIEAPQRESSARLLGAVRALSAQPSNKSAIDQVLGRSGTQTTGTGT